MGYLLKANVSIKKRASKRGNVCQPRLYAEMFQAMELTDPRHSGRLFWAGAFSQPGHFRRASEKPVISLSPVC